jgi:hypothetical protein
VNQKVAEEHCQIGAAMILQLILGWLEEVLDGSVRDTNTRAANPLIKHSMIAAATSAGVLRSPWNN